jgi:hypothetical protein
LRTRVIESHGGDLWRDTNYTEHKPDVCRTHTIQLPSGAPLPADALHSLSSTSPTVSTRRESGGSTTFVIFPAHGDELVDLLSARLPRRLPTGWKVQIWNCDPGGRDLYAGKWICLGKHVTLQ